MGCSAMTECGMAHGECRIWNLRQRGAGNSEFRGICQGREVRVVCAHEFTKDSAAGADRSGNQSWHVLVVRLRGIEATAVLRRRAQGRRIRTAKIQPGRKNQGLAMRLQGQRRQTVLRWGTQDTGRLIVSRQGSQGYVGLLSGQGTRGQEPDMSA